MNKTKTIIFSISAMVFTVGVFAAGNFITLSRENKPETTVKIEEKSQLYKEYNSKAVFDAKLTNEKENAVFEALNKSGKTKNEIYDDIFNYKKFILMYNPSDESLKVVDNLIISGADMMNVFGIYHFWQTTCENPTIIKDIYNLSEKYTGTFWIEEAYNEITNYAHGILNEEQVNNYRSQGLENEDIRIANILSRKGVYKINEILEKKISGDSWENIISTVLGTQNKHSSLASKITDSLQLSNYIMFKDTDFGININSFDELHIAIDNRRNDCIGKAHNELNKAKIIKRIENDTDSQSYKDYEAKIISNGISKEEMEELYEKGYSASEVLNASEIQKNTGTNVMVALEGIRLDRQTEEVTTQ